MSPEITWEEISIIISALAARPARAGGLSRQVLHLQCGTRLAVDLAAALLAIRLSCSGGALAATAWDARRPLSGSHSIGINRLAGVFDEDSDYCLIPRA